MEANLNTNFSVTENGDKSLLTSNSDCLDFFVRITRSAPFNDYIDSFTKAWRENKETAIKILMNMRDVRGGKGEKLIPAVIMVYLKFTIEPNVYEAILQKMIEYGYWKDLLRIIEIESRTLLDINKRTVLNKSSVEVKLFAEKLGSDMRSLLDDAVSNGLPEQKSQKKVAISLCGKWAPSEKSHYDHHPMCAATNIMNEMGLNPKQYRTMLTKLRNHLNVLETLMSNQQFDQIDFSKLPSVAMMKMKHAFSRDTNAKGVESESRKKLHVSYQEYLRKLHLGKTKVNVKGIQPHELVSTYMSGSDIDILVEAQWDAIKKHVMESGSFRDVTAIVDVSSSMSGQPMEVAIALGILVAECTKGPYHGKAITFNDKPEWHVLTGTTLKDKVNCMRHAPWGGSTNLRATFDMILEQAISAELTADEMVKTLFIFTDMQFNQCDHGSWESTFEYARRKYETAGYALPRIVCWNLRTSSSKSIPVTKNENGFVMLSGFSAELLKCIIGAKEFTPMSMLLHVLEPYETPFELTNCAATDLVTTSNFLPSLETGVKKSEIKKAFKSVGPTDTKPIDPICVRVQFRKLVAVTNSSNSSSSSSDSDSSCD